MDPELASLFSQDTESSSTGDTPKSELAPQKVQIKVTYVSLMETVNANIRNLIDQLSKPVKIIMLNVSIMCIAWGQKKKSGTNYIIFLEQSIWYFDGTILQKEAAGYERHGIGVWQHSGGFKGDSFKFINVNNINQQNGYVVMG